MSSIESIRKVARTLIYLAVIVTTMQPHRLSFQDRFGCRSEPKFWEAEEALTKARGELNRSKYIKANKTIKHGIAKLGIPEDAPRCEDCVDEGNLQFPHIEYEEGIGNIEAAARGRYRDFNELIQIYLNRKCPVPNDLDIKTRLAIEREQLKSMMESTRSDSTPPP